MIKRVSTIATIILIATAIFGPLLGGPSVAGVTIYMFRALLPLYLIGLTAAVWTGYIPFTTDDIPLAGWLLAGFAGWVTISVLWSPSAASAISRLGIILTGIALSVTIYVTGTDEATLSRYVNVLLGLAVLSFPVAAWEIVTGGHLSTSRLLLTRYADIAGPVGIDFASAWFYNRNNLLFFLSITVGPFAARAVGPDSRLFERLTAVVAITTIATLGWINGSRSALMMIALAIVVVVLVRPLQWLSWRPTPSRYGRAAVTGAVCCAAIVIAAVFLTRSNPFTEPGSLWVRWQLGIEALDLLFKSGGLGVGIGGFQVLVTPIGPLDIINPHNWLFYLLAEFGVLGTVFFLVTYARILYDLAVQSVASSSAVTLGLFATLITLPVGAVGPSNAVLTQPFWIALALGLTAAYRVRDTVHPLA